MPVNLNTCHKYIIDKIKLGGDGREKICNRKTTKDFSYCQYVDMGTICDNVDCI